MCTLFAPMTNPFYPRRASIPQNGSWTILFVFPADSAADYRQSASSTYGWPCAQPYCLPPPTIITSSEERGMDISNLHGKKTKNYVSSPELKLKRKDTEEQGVLVFFRCCKERGKLEANPHTRSAGFKLLRLCHQLPGMVDVRQLKSYCYEKIP